MQLQQGDFVEVRGRHWLVEAIDDAQADLTTVRLSAPVTTAIFSASEWFSGPGDMITLLSPCSRRRRELGGVKERSWSMRCAHLGR